MEKIVDTVYRIMTPGAKVETISEIDAMRIAILNGVHEIYVVNIIEKVQTVGILHQEA